MTKRSTDLDWRLYSSGVKHKAQGSEWAQRRVESGSLISFRKAEGVHRFEVFNCI